MEWKRILMWTAVGALVLLTIFLLWSSVACANAENRMTGETEFEVHAEEHTFDATVDTGESPTEQVSHMDTGYESEEDDDDDW